MLIFLVRSIVAYAIRLDSDADATAATGEVMKYAIDSIMYRPNGMSKLATVAAASRESSSEIVNKQPLSRQNEFLEQSYVLSARRLDLTSLNQVAGGNLTVLVGADSNLWLLGSNDHVARVDLDAQRVSTFVATSNVFLNRFKPNIVRLFLIISSISKYQQYTV